MVNIVEKLILISLITFIFLVFPLAFSQVEIKYFYLPPSQILECSYGSTVSTSCNQNVIAYIKASDNIYYLAKFSENKETWGRYNFSHLTSFPSDINPIKIEVGMEAYKVKGTWVLSSRVCDWGGLNSSSALGDDSDDKCYFQVFENSSSTYNYYYVLNPSQASCNEWGTSDTLKVYDVTNFFDHILKLKNSGAVFYGYDDDDRCTGMQIDWLFFNVTYFPLTYSNFNFYNFSTGEILTNLNIKRGTKINASALFNIKDVNITYIEHNATGTFQKHFDLVTIVNSSTCVYGTQTFNCSFWINFTLDTSDLTRFSKVGPISARIFANNSFGGYNITEYKTFYLYGYSKVSEIYLNDSYIYPGQSVTASCKIIDANLSYPIENYLVNFYLNGNFVGTSITNSSGVASIEISGSNFASLGTYEIKCNITDNSTLYYYASENKELKTYLKVLNLTVPFSIAYLSLNYGNEQIIKINVTNASEIVQIYLNISYFNISNCKLQKTYEIKYPIFEICYYPDLCAFNFSFVPPRSGNYDVTVYVNASSPYGAVQNYSSFSVSFGNSKLFVLNPFYYVLTNQTFYIVLAVKAENGDLWNVSTNISISNQIAINLTSDETNYHSNSIEAVASDSYCIDKWRSISKYVAGSETTTITFYAYPTNGTFSSYLESFEIILPLNPYIDPNTSFIDENVTFYVPIFGNASSFKINSTIFKPYNSGIENVIFESSFAKNYTECGIKVEKGNVASLFKGSIATSTDSNANSTLAIDENFDTAWNHLDNIFAQLDVTFRQIFTIQNFSITWQGPSTTTTYANISFRDATGNIIVIATNIALNSTKTKVTFDMLQNFGQPIKMDKIIINVSGTASIYEIEAYPVEPRLDYCYVYYYVYNNFTRSGYYDVNFEALTEFNDIIFLNPSNFFINYGIPILNVVDTYPAMLTDQYQIYKVNVTAYRGDLLNLTLRFWSQNESYINITQNEIYEKVVNELLWKNSTIIQWNISAKLLGEPSITIETRVYANSSYAYQNTSTSFNITIYPFDLIPPVIEDFWFEYKGLKTDKANLNYTLEIIANVSDNIFVAEVTASIIYPSNIIINASLKRGNLWSFTFLVDNSQIQINETGNFVVRIIAKDLNESNINISSGKNFFAYDIYFIDYEPKFVIFNRGENITFITYDINGFVENVNWNINLSTNNITYNFSSFSENFTLIFEKYFEVGKYEINVSSEKYGNKGNVNLSIELTNILQIEIKAPPENSVYEPNSSISGPDLPRIKIYNYRGDREIKNANVSVACYNSSSYYHLFENILGYGFCGFFPNLYSFFECEAKCYSAPNYNQIFNISFYAIDDFNNSGFAYVILRTPQLAAPAQAPAPVPTFPAFPPPAERGEWTAWKDVGCGAGICKADEMYQVRYYIVGNKTQKIEERCIKSLLCAFPRLEFEITPKFIEVEQGKNTTLIATIKNVGEIDANIKVFAKCEVCSFIEYEKEIKIKRGETYSFSIIIGTNLTLDPGEYITSFTFESKNISSKIDVTLKVKRNSLFDIFDFIISKTNELSKKVEELKNYKLIDEEEKILFEINEIINEIKENIESNEIIRFEENLKLAQTKLNLLEKKIREKQILLFLYKYWPHILAVFLASSALTYLTTQILIPLVKIEKEVRKLREEEKSLIRARIELEKQYFTRKISEEMFRKMIMEREQQILHVRGKIKVLSLEKDKILKERLHPKAWINWIASIRYLPRKTLKIKESIKKEIEDIKKLIEKLKERKISIYGTNK